jgi:nucleoside-diphosphate-sugar epimerase
MKGPLMPETVLVTGGTGYVGGWCIVELLRRGYTVRTTVRNLSKEGEVRAAVASAVDAGDRLTFFAADLMKDKGWDAALAGCDYVLHVASPLGGGDPNDKESLVAPARDGALRVLRAATQAGVKRVVMTSAATVATPPMSGPDSVNDETVWFDPNEDVDAYRHSKRLAERAAFDFMKSYHGATTLTTVLPGAVFGPILTTKSLGSTEIIRRLLQGRVPANPRFGLQIVDVRDLADLHIRAMISPQAAGERFLGVGEFMWMAEISQALRSQLGAAASEVPTRTMPDFLFRLFALFDPSLRAMTPRLGRKVFHTAAKAQRLLGWQSRPAKTTLVDCAESLISRHVV